MIIEVVVARNHVGFNERIFSLTDGALHGEKRKKVFETTCWLLRMTGCCKTINPNLSCDGDAVTDCDPGFELIYVHVCDRMFSSFAARKITDTKVKVKKKIVFLFFFNTYQIQQC